MQTVLDYAKLLTFICLYLSDSDIPCDRFRDWFRSARKLAKRYQCDGFYVNFFADISMNGDIDLKKIGLFKNKLLVPLYQNIKSYESKVHVDLVNYIHKCTQFISKPYEERYWTYIKNNHTILKDIEINKCFVSQLKLRNLTKIYNEMVDIVYRLIGIKRPLLYQPDRDKLRKDEKYDQYVEYLKKYSNLLKILNGGFVHNLRIFVVKYGKNVFKNGLMLVKFEEAKQFLQKLGCDKLCSGFDGYLDSDGNHYTLGGKKLSAVPLGTVEMNPKYNLREDNTYVCRLLELNRNISTQDRNKNNKNSKFSHVNDFLKREQYYVNKWRKDLFSDDEYLKLCSTVVDILYRTKARIGGIDNSTEGKATYGISTLLKEHIRFSKNTVFFEYSGKKNHLQYHKIVLDTDKYSKQLGNNLKFFINKKLKTVFPQYISNGRKKTILLSHAVRAYLKKLNVPVSPHGFRHAFAQTTTQNILGSLNDIQFNTGNELEKAIRDEIVKYIATVLHHESGSKLTSTTALNAYIDPRLIKQEYDRRNLRLTKFFETLNGE